MPKISLLPDKATELVVADELVCVSGGTTSKIAPNLVPNYLDDGTTKIMFKKLTGTAASTQGGSTQVPTLITGTVLGVSCKMAGVDSNTRDPGSIEYSLANYGANVIHVVNSASNSSGLLNQPFTLLVIYID